MRTLKSKMPGVRARTSHPVQEKKEVFLTPSLSSKDPEPGIMDEPEGWFVRMMKKIFIKKAPARILKNK